MKTEDYKVTEKEMETMKLEELFEYARKELYKGYFREDKEALLQGTTAERIYHERGGEGEIL